MLIVILLMVISLSGGFVVGTAIASFITLIDVIPRLAQLTNTRKNIPLYQNVFTISIVVITIITFSGYHLNYSWILIIIPGLMMGFFIGLVAAALAEVLNVIPVLMRRFKLEGYIPYTLIALTLGKVIGSLIQWLIFKK